MTSHHYLATTDPVEDRAPSSTCAPDHYTNRLALERAMRIDSNDKEAATYAKEELRAAQDAAIVGLSGQRHEPGKTWLQIMESGPARYRSPLRRTPSKAAPRSPRGRLERAPGREPKPSAV